MVPGKVQVSLKIFSYLLKHSIYLFSWPWHFACEVQSDFLINQKVVAQWLSALRSLVLEVDPHSARGKVSGSKRTFLSVIFAWMSLIKIRMLTGCPLYRESHGNKTTR